MASRVSAGENISLHLLQSGLTDPAPRSGSSNALRFLLFVVIYFAVMLLVIFLITRGPDNSEGFRLTRM